MNLDRFKDFDQDVRELVLSFENQKDGRRSYFDPYQLEVIADYYLEVGDAEGLEAVVRWGETLFPNNNGIRLRKAHLLCFQGQYSPALELLKELERAEPDNTDVSYALGALFSMLNDPQMSIRYFKIAACDGFQLDMIYGNIADEYCKKENYTMAVRYYRMAIKENPNEERSLRNLLFLWDLMDERQKTVPFFSKLVREHPYSKYGWYCLAIAYGWLRTFDKAIDALGYAIAIDQKFELAYDELAECYLQMGEMDKAVQILRESLDFTEDRPFVLSRIATAYIQMENYHTASVYLHDALKENPNLATAWSELGLCSEKLGFYDEAAGHYRRAIDLDPYPDSYWLKLADIYITTERYLEAAALLESARGDAQDLFLFDTRLIYCYFKSGRRNRLFALMTEDAHDFGGWFERLLYEYPEMSQDPEVVTYIHSIKSPKKQ